MMARQSHEWWEEARREWLWDPPSPQTWTERQVRLKCVFCGPVRDCGVSFFIEVPASQKTLVCVKWPENCPTQPLMTIFITETEYLTELT